MPSEKGLTKGFAPHSPLKILPIHTKKRPPPGHDRWWPCLFHT